MSPPFTPAVASRTDIAAINVADIKLLRSSLGDDAERIIALFLKETGDRLLRMARLADLEQRNALAREAHSLKSSAATFGCPGLANLALQLEEEAASRQAIDLTAHLALLFDCYRQAQAALLSASRDGTA